MKRTICLVLVFALLNATVLPCWSQNAPATSPGTTPAACNQQGRADGKETSTGGALAIGLVSGLGLGLIGTIVAVVAQGEPEPPADKVAALQDTECRLEYKDAYGKSGKGKKRGAALLGGLLGTAALVAIVASSNSGSE